MPPHSIGTGTISFGLVSIPIKLYPATSPAGVSFNMLHAKCGSRLRQQMLCPVCNEVVDRSQTVRGYEVAKDQYVRVADEELKALEGEASKTIDIAEFVPLEKVDPIYFERTYYLGPDKSGEKPYRLLADAMAHAGQVALATFIMRGKETLVLLRPAQGGLMMHTMYFADEVRNFGEIERGADAKIREGELDLALQLIRGLAADDFQPERYKDDYRQRVLDMIQRKVEGQEVTVPPPAAPRAQVIDLMDALQKSLQGGKPGRRAAAAAPSRAAAPAAPAAAAEKKPLAKSKRAQPAPAARKAQGGRT
jgi:DNA end-binding protein Ku